MNDLGQCANASIPLTVPSARQAAEGRAASAIRRPKNTSLTAMVRDVRKGYHYEDMIWLLLALSALALLGLSMWL